jgi:hypothetical protein
VVTWCGVWGVFVYVVWERVGWERDPFNSSLVAGAAAGGPCSRSVVACLALGDNVLSMKFASSPTMLPATIVDCHHHYLAPSEPFHAYINALGAPG